MRDPDLQAQVLTRLRQGWSPAQVAGRLKKEYRGQVISYESIYRFIDSQIRRTKDYDWRHYLPRGKSKRGWRGRKGGSSVDSPSRVRGNDEQCSELYSAIVQLLIILHADGPLAMLDF